MSDFFKPEVLLEQLILDLLNNTLHIIAFSSSIENFLFGGVSQNEYRTYTKQILEHPFSPHSLTTGVYVTFR